MTLDTTQPPLFKLHHSRHQAQFPLNLLALRAPAKRMEHMDEYNYSAVVEGRNCAH